ncbi:DUF823 domain-containing adhesin, partial [Xenorhabdus sp. XENO-10]
TTIDGTDRKQETVIEFDENKAPSISNLQLEGVLHVKGVLHALYQFDAKEGNATDRSFYVWGEKGSTAKRVVALADAAGTKEPIELAQKNGEGRVAAGATDKDKVKYTIESRDIGKVLEVSVLAANEANLRAKAPLTTDVSDPNANQGITGGNGKGGVADPNAKPQVKIVELTGKLTLPTTLTALYQFEPNGGDETDKSRYIWKVEGETPTATDWKGITNTSHGSQQGQVLVKLEENDKAAIAGKVIAISILPINGAGQDNQEGIATVTTSPDDPVNKTTGGGQDKDGKRTGTMVDPDAKPTIRGLILGGYLDVDKELTATYTFEANTGDPEDTSEYTWSRLDSGSDDKPTGSPHKIKGGQVKNGQVPPYQVQKDDVGKFIEIKVQARHKGQLLADQIIVVNSNQGEDAGNGNKDLSGAGDGEGRVIDPATGPQVSDLQLTLSGDGSALSATYNFNPGTGNTEDRTHYQWGTFLPGEENQTDIEIANAQRVAENQDHKQQPHRVPEFPLKPEHVGRLIGLSIQGRNGYSDINPNNDQGIGNTTSTDTGKFTKLTGVNQDGTMKGVADEFTVDVDKDKAKAKIDLVNNEPESIELTIKTQKDNKSIGGVPVTINLSAVSRYHNATETPTAKLEAQKGVLAIAQPHIYTGHTDENGDLVIKISDPNGKGVKTTLKVTAEGANGSLPAKDQDVIFTVITSPDMPVANYWGHMHDTIKFNGIKYYRTPLHNEYTGTKDEGGDLDNEDWAYYNSDVVKNVCSRNGKVLPTSNELVELGRHYAINQVHTRFGWPTEWSYYSSSLELVNLSAGKNNGEGNNVSHRFAACRDKN